MSAIHHLIVGPAQHGVTRHALQLAEAAGAQSITRLESFRHVDLPEGPVHVTFTDHLFGNGPEVAVDNLLALVGNRALSVSLHDIPQPEEGAERFAHRAHAYRRLLHAARLTVVNSAHEARHLPGARVIRLPIPAVDSPFQPEPRTVGVLGFLYPGKGHEDIIQALAGTDYRLRFLGAVSQGHEKWADDLVESARSTGLDVEVTGWLGDDDLAAEMGRVSIPVCPHRHFSASGSLMTWLGAGRHVLVTDSDYAQEIDEWLPGRMTLVTDWREAIDAYADRLACGESEPLEPPRYGWAEVAAEWSKEWARCEMN